MLEYFSIAPWLLLGLVAAAFGLLPLVTWFTYRMEEQVTLELLSLDATINQEVDEYLGTTSQRLAEMGFEPVGLVSVPQMVSNVRLWMKWFINQQTEDHAFIQVYFSKPNEEWSLFTQCVEFNSEYGKDFEVNTTNQKVMPIWPEDPRRVISYFPEQNDLAWLYGAHQAICRHHAGARKKTLDLYSQYNGDVVRSLVDAMHRDSTHPLREGYIYLIKQEPAEENAYAPPNQTAPASVYGATLKGAYVMTWQLIWPIKPMMRRRFISKSLQRLEDSGYRGVS